jgi:hypothetical protein
MEVPSTAIAVGVTALAIPLFESLSANRCERRAASVRYEQFRDRSFRPSRSNYLLAVAAAAFGWWAFSSRELFPHTAGMILGLACFFWALAGTFFILLINTSAHFSRGVFSFRFGQKECLRVQLSAIRGVHASGGFLVAELDNARRELIPMIFAENHIILAMLRNYRP